MNILKWFMKPGSFYGRSITHMALFSSRESQPPWHCTILTQITFDLPSRRLLRNFRNEAGRFESR